MIRIQIILEVEITLIIKLAHKIRRIKNYYII